MNVFLNFLERTFTLLAYTITGFACCYLGGFEIKTCFGIGIMFGFIMGVINEIHRDLVFFINEYNKNKLNHG